MIIRKKGEIVVEDRMYLCIDLKSFYASVECVERHLDPLTTNLVVADPERGDKTICLAVSSSMKALGVRNRCRVFEIPGSIKYIMAPPRMKKYIAYSADIYGIYLKYIAKEDIHVYSIDEAFLDVTDYLALYGIDARNLAGTIMQDIKRQTGITATAGIGTNLYLAKVALDIMAKHVSDHIGYLDEKTYCRTLWDHKPLTDFWRIGPGTVRRLNSLGLLTMGDVAHANEDALYRMFGIDAELLLDHAWGREDTTIADIKAYRPENSSISSGQVLARDYSFEECRLVVKEMVDDLCLNLADRGLVTGSVTLTLGYSNALKMHHVNGTVSLPAAANTYRAVIPGVMELYERIVNPALPVRRLSLSANNVTDEAYEQYSFFVDAAETERDRRLQQAALQIKKKYGKNALVRGMDLQEAGTTMERNRQIGGHKSGE